MFDRMAGMQAMTRQAELVAWVRADKQAAQAQAQRAGQERHGNGHHPCRGTIAAVLRALAMRLEGREATPQTVRGMW
jgi:hypothetical protein